MVGLWGTGTVCTHLHRETRRYALKQNFVIIEKCHEHECKTQRKQVGRKAPENSTGYRHPQALQPLRGISPLGFLEVGSRW